MYYYTPKKIWDREACYIIGGGPSLKTFNWKNLSGRNVIGCNASFYMGADLIPIMIFGDGAFLQQHKEGLDNYSNQGGRVYTCATRTDRFGTPDYLKIVKRKVKGLGIKDELGWNSNTGSAAINLALLFGCQTIYLLGYDMQLSEQGEKNFHDAYSDRANPRSYDRFLKGFQDLKFDKQKHFPDQEIINLEDGTSALNIFPKQSLENHFEKVAV